jgi:hypothetical protein
MTVISMASRWLPAQPAAAPMALRATATASATAAPARIDSATRFTRTPPAGSADTYADPSIATKTTTRAIGSLWAAPARSGDAIGTLMANNHSTRIYNLAEQWRGLGGALLRHLGETGEGYSQARVNDPASFDDPDVLAALPPELLAQHAAEMAAAQTAALAGVADQASAADLQLRLASGQTVQLRLTDSAGFGPIGMQVSITASGTLSDEERAAVQALADGLDRALAGLGQPDAARLDLSGLLGYDRQVIAGLDLTVNNAQNRSFLGHFELHMGGEKPSLLLKGVDGEMRLSLDAGKAPAGAPTARHAQTLRNLLARIDAAGQRGQANVALVEQMKSAMAQLQTAVADTVTAPAGSGSATPGGMADFEASFSGDTWRLNGAGTHRQGGTVAYQLSQRTEASGVGAAPTRQTVSEQLSADFKEAPGDRMLNVRNGNHTATQVRDRRTVTTLIESVAGGAVRASRKTDEEQLKTVTGFEGGRVVSRQAWPGQRAWVESVG